MSEIAVRPTRAEDRATVLAFSQQTWEWGDYIERTWDEWLADPQGQLFTATADHQPVGIIRLQMVTPNDAWLQGLRVDPAYRRRGIARALHETATAEAMQRGATYIRLSIESDNTPSIRLAEHMHMRQVGSFRLYSATPFPPQHRPTRQQHTQIATFSDIDEIIDYLNASSIFPLVGGLYYVRWMAQPITAEWLEERVDAKQVYLLRRWERIDGLALAEMRQDFNEQSLSIGYIDGTAIEAISLIAYDLRRRLPEMELDHVHIYAPDMVLVQDAFDGVEYKADTNLYHTFERSLF
jgi:RimJ/RimL family protein N-acetyltransferase